MANSSISKLHEEAVALFRQEKFETALEKFEAALRVESSGNIKQIAEVYNDIGVTHKQLGDYQAAHTALDEAMTRFIELNDMKGQAQTLGNRASVYADEGLLDEAVNTYKKSAAILEEISENEMAMYVWQAISRLRMKQGQPIAAIGAYEEGIENLPKSSLKRRLLQKILKMPNSMLGGSGEQRASDQNEE